MSHEVVRRCNLICYKRFHDSSGRSRDCMHYTFFAEFMHNMNYIDDVKFMHHMDYVHELSTGYFVSET